MSIPLVLCGSLGRMGQAIQEMAKTNSNFCIVACVVRTIREASEPYPLYDKLEHALRAITKTSPSAIVVDFSSADQARDHVTICKEYGHPLLLGTTGLDDGLAFTLEEATKAIAIVKAPNTSLMAELMRLLCERAASLLKESDISIVDLHHAQKKDAPSGTTKNLLKTINDARPNKNKPSVYAMRHGTVAGEHTVSFFNQFERLEIAHRVENRLVFAEGALVAAQFLAQARPGLYDMKDVLNKMWQ